MFKLLYGEFKFKTTADIIFSLFKGLYLIFTCPVLLVAGMLGRYGFKGPSQSKEKIGPIKRVLVHFSAIFWGISLWAIALHHIKVALK